MARARATIVPDVAVVTGANRGIGLEVCRQLGHFGTRVALGARDLEKGRDETNTLGAWQRAIVFLPLLRYL